MDWCSIKKKYPPPRRGWFSLKLHQYADMVHNATAQTIVPAQLTYVTQHWNRDCWKSDTETPSQLKAVLWNVRLFFISWPWKHLFHPAFVFLNCLSPRWPFLRILITIKNLAMPSGTFRYDDMHVRSTWCSLQVWFSWLTVLKHVQMKNFSP